jgi:N-acetylneuraminic acid mutarotase
MTLRHARQAKPPASPRRRAGRRPRRAALGALATLATLAAFGLIPQTAALAGPTTSPGRAATPAGVHSQPRLRNVCPRPTRIGFAACLSIVRTGLPSRRGLLAGGSLPSGYDPANLRSAYHLPSATAGAGQTVAIVDAYDDPTAESDLATYRAQYHLPPCTTSDGCFRKVAQDGSTNYPTPDGDWAAEISLDLDMVSAICPNCHILLVEANDDSIQDLGLAVDEAVRLGAKYVSNSYGGSEDPGESSWDAAYYDHPGVAVTAAAGDGGYGVSYPAASPYVTAVGGTTLTRDPGVARGWAETAWSGTGSGCSAYEPKPSWQHDHGCAHRTDNDVSAVANPDTGVAVYDTYPCYGCGIGFGWNVLGGTSVSSPIIASTFALAGAPLAGSYPSSYPYARPSALNNVTSGSNGSCTPSYLCTAGPGYNGPTGLGTPNGVAAFTHPHGNLAGAVTDAATGKPLAGALVQAGAATAVTGAGGTYNLALLPGVYRVQVVDYSGFAAGTARGVQVTTGHSTAADFALSPAPDVSVSGTVTDGSGHGWPLYAQVSVPGSPATAYTDPATGRYRLRLPRNGSYTVQASPLSPGYQALTRPLTTGTSDLTLDFTSPADGFACTALGYHFVAKASENFNQKTTPPGWTVTTTGDPANDWQFDQPGGYHNLTGGSGNYAVAYVQNSSGADTDLTSPVVNLSGDRSPVLTFDSFDETLGFHQDSVELSTDAGKNWATVLATPGLLEGPVSVPLPAAASKPSVRVRFSFTATGGTAGMFWQVDDFALTECDPAAGGLVVGRVTDANTGQGIDGATVAASNQGGQPATFAAAPGGPPGFYSLFSARTGLQRVAASAPDYAPQSRAVSVTSGQVSPAGFILAAGRIAVSTSAISGTAPIGGRATVRVTVRNTGTAPASLDISTAPGGFAPAGASGSVRGAPTRRIPGHYPLGRVAATPRAQGVAVAPGAGGQPWTPIASYPVPDAYTAAAADPGTGRLYVAGGINVATGNVLASGYVFDPATGRWSALPPMPHPTSEAQAAFIGGRLYVTGGTYTPANLVTIPYTQIYDPESGRWTSGANLPKAYYGAGTAVLDGKMYLVGGCDPVAGFCGRTDVQVYDPATDNWSTAASYPIPAAFLACGGIGGRLICAGGASGQAGASAGTTTSAGYEYNPGTNSWAPIASLPQDQWGGAYAAANGQLLISGGVTAHGTILTNQGYAYDPARDAWSALPASTGVPVYQSASACGFYQVGGWAQDGSNIYPMTAAARLPGYADCGGEPWLSASPARLSLAPGRHATITVTMNAAPRVIGEPGTYTASLQFASNTPYLPPTVQASLTATPPPSWGRLAGTVDGRSCAGTTAPLAGATLQVTGQGGNSWTLTTDRNGRYQLWLDASNSPVTEIVSQYGWKPQTAAVTITARATATRDFTLSTVTCL